jgi:hypothetical protein
MNRIYLVASLRALPITFLLLLLELALAIPLALPVSMELSRLGTGSWDAAGQAALLDGLAAARPLTRTLGLQASLAAGVWIVLSPLLHMAWLSALSSPMSPARALGRGGALLIRALLVSFNLAFVAVLMALPWVFLAWCMSRLFSVEVHARAHDVGVALSLVPLVPTAFLLHTWHDLARARALEHGPLASVTRSARHVFRLGMLARALLLTLGGTLLVLLAELWVAQFGASGLIAGSIAALLVYGALFAKLWLRSLWLCHALGAAEATDTDDTTTYHRGKLP